MATENSERLLVEIEVRNAEFRETYDDQTDDEIARALSEAFDRAFPMARTGSLTVRKVTRVEQAEDVEAEAPVRCLGCHQKHRGGLAKPCNVHGCECYCMRVTMRRSR
jgi:hypothetical protein